MVFSKNNSPIIILGMHRSGTTLLSRILDESGIHMGNRLNIHHEGMLFFRLNELLLTVGHSYWDNPTNLKHIYNDSLTYYKIIEKVKDELASPKSKIGFWGIKRKLFSNTNIPWGWKDPRNTITFPLWHSIFPSAKFIYIHRNGVDVAASLRSREEKKKGLINRRFHSIRCHSLKESFKLWEEYNDFFEQNKNLLPEENVLTVSYEELLNNPKEQINMMYEYLNVPINPDLTNSICKKIKPGNAYKFKNDKSLKDFYLEIRNSSLMKKYNYDKIL